MKRFLFWLLLITTLIVISGIIYVFLFNKKASTLIPFIFSKNPFGLASNNPNIKIPPLTTGTTSGTIYTATSSLPKIKIKPLLYKVWNKPVAGYSFTNKTYSITSTSTNKKGAIITTRTVATSSLLFFVEKESGHVYVRDLQKEITYRLSNTTISGIYDAYFIDNGSEVALRTFDRKSSTIKTLFVDIPYTEKATSSPSSLQNISYLANNISSLVESPSKKSLIYLVKEKDGGTVYEIKKDRKVITLGNYPLSELQLSTSRNTLYATTNASAFVSGESYTLPYLTPLYGGKTGLTTNISPDGNMLLSSMWSSSGLLTFIVSLKTGVERVLSLQTLVEKCAWNTYSLFIVCGVPETFLAPVYGLPDDWYQGAFPLKDTLHLIGVANIGESFIFDVSKEAGEDVDVINTSFNTGGSLFAFINKNNSILYTLDFERLSRP